MVVTEGLHFKIIYSSEDNLRRHKQTGSKLICLNLFAVYADARSGIPRRNQVSPINVHVLTRLKLMSQVKVSNFMRNGKALAVLRITLLNSDDSRIAFTNQKTGYIFAQVSVNDLQAQTLCYKIHVNRWIAETAGAGQRFPL